MKFKYKFTVLIEENQEIFEIFEMYFLLLHKNDLVVVVLNHFLLKSNPQNTFLIFKKKPKFFLPVEVVLLIVFSLDVLHVIYFLIFVYDSI